MVGKGGGLKKLHKSVWSRKEKSLIKAEGTVEINTNTSTQIITIDVN